MKTVYPWHLSQWQALNRLMEDNCLPHAFLFHGVKDIGKFRCAEVLAESVLCDSQVNGYACGFCKQCLLLNSGFHPDLMVLEPEGASNTIKIDAIRGLIHFLSMTSQQGGWKVAIIQQAEKMNTNAANALLKSLEEPVSSTLLILVSNDFSQLIPTVKSRCRQLPFPLPDEILVLPWLSGVLSSGDNSKELLESAFGRPLWALRLLSEGLLENRAKLEDLWQGVATGQMSPLDCAEQCSLIEGELALEWLYLHVSAFIKTAKNSSVTRMAFKFIDHINEAKQLLLSKSNPNKQLLWEELMLDWKAVGSK